MEKGNWKIGNHPSTVVSDVKVKNTNFPTPLNPEESPNEDLKFYGGYLVCESIGNTDHAKLIAAAPDMKLVLDEVIKGQHGELQRDFIARIQRLALNVVMKINAA